MEKCKKVDGCKIVFSLASKNNKYHYEFKKNVVFQSSKILDLSFQLDDSYKPEDYLKQIPSQDDFANTTIDALQPYRSGCTFADIKRRDNTTNAYFGYSTPTVPQTDPGYDEMLLRYVDITNMLKADICYTYQVYSAEINNWAASYYLPISVAGFEMNFNLKYDLETATIVSLSASGTATTTFNGQAVLKINLLTPYRLFGTFQTNFPLPTYFSQLVPTDGDNNDKYGLYELSITFKILGMTIIDFDQFYSYVGDEIFGDPASGRHLGFYLPNFFLKNCDGKIHQLVLDASPFTPTNKFILINGANLDKNNFLNIGIFKDMSSDPNASDDDYGTSYFSKDAKHMDNNNFTVKVENSSKEYTLPWGEVTSFYNNWGANNINYDTDDGVNYHINFFLNHCFTTPSGTEFKIFSDSLDYQ